ncbi:MAG: hypothetical protein LLF92_11570 [Planctomycetaceae bacterium]|nr:hypothetical protein [Planctomycetaceae bacterium]
MPNFDEVCLGHLLGQNVQKTTDSSGRSQNKNSHNTHNTLLMKSPIPSRGVEPVKENSQAITSKEVMKNESIDLTDCLAAKNQTNLKKVIEAWPKLSEYIQKAILALVG